MILRSFILIIIMACLAGAQDLKPKIWLRGSLLDTSFVNADSVKIEILENGLSANTKYGQAFEIELSQDTSWNLCASDSEKEQCYIISQNSGDSIIEADLNNDNQFEVFSSFVSDKKARELLDQKEEVEVASNIQGDEDSQEVEKQTRLRKLVVTVKKRPKRSLGQSTVSAKNIKRMPGLAEADVVKAIQALPGVVSSSDFSSKIYVRGGGADQNLFLFDNAVVYSPVHFFGLFSTFLVEGVDKVDFYKGGFSPEYGNRLSSVVDITTRPGGKQEDTLNWMGSAQISTFASTLNLEGAKNGTQINLSGRATYLKEILWGLREAGLTDIDLDYRFYDIQGSYHQKINDDMNFSIAYYGGEDRLIFTPLEVVWGNQAIPINFYWDIDSKWYFEGSYAYSKFDQTFELENIFTFENNIESHDTKLTVEYRGVDDQTWRFGIQEQYINTAFGNKSTSISLVDEDSFLLSSPFVEQILNLNDFQFKTGMRFNHTTALNKIYVEPRFSIRYNLSETQKIDFHVGKYEQLINSIIFSDFETINEFYYPSRETKFNQIEPSNSLLFSLGYSQNFFENYDLIVEGYYKTLNNLLVFAPSQVPDSVSQSTDAILGDRLITGEGYSLGAEFSFRKNTGVISGGVSYSYSYSVINELDLAIPAKWDMPHAFKIDAAINWRDPKENAIYINPKKPYFRSSMQIKYSSGLPYSGVVGYAPSHQLDQSTNGEGAGGPTPSFDGNISTPLGSTNSNRYPDYFRFDIKVVDWGRENKWNLSWTLLNITNNENVFSYTFDTKENPPKRSTIPQFPFFPLLINYQYYF